MRLLPAFLLLAILTRAAEPIPRFTDPRRRARLAAAFPEIERIFERFHRDRGAPGSVFGVIVDGDLALVKSYGLRDRAANDPVTPETVFRIASMTKSFTALAILKLRDEGRLSLDDPASKWIPELAKMPYPTRDTAPIRVRQLLTHGMGLPEDNPWGDRQLAIPPAELDRWLRAGLPFSTPPDTAYEYSNYGFALAGRIVAKASGMPYRDYVEKRILAPLAMTSSTLEPSAVPANLRATGYGRDGDRYIETPPLAHGEFGAMGGMLVSARDLARYVAFHLAPWPPRDDPETGPVRRASVREMQRAHRASSFVVTRSGLDAPLRASAGGYGYGLAATRDCRFSHIVGHAGGLPGFGSYMAWLPEHGVGIFGMTNLTYTAPSPAVNEAFDALLRTGALKPRELPPSSALTAARDAIFDLWREWTGAKAAALATDNLFQDVPAASYRSGIERLKQDTGECRAAGEVKPENLLRGTFRIDCARGAVDVAFTLAPTNPPKTQYLRFTPVMPLDSRLKEIVAEAAKTRAADLARSGYGTCRIGETLSGNGRTQAAVRLDCDRGAVTLRVEPGDRILLSLMPGTCPP